MVIDLLQLNASTAVPFVFQDPQRMPKTSDSTKPHISCVFFTRHTHSTQCSVEILGKGMIHVLDRQDFIVLLRMVCSLKLTRCLFLVFSI